MELQGTETRENIMKRIKFLLKGSEEEERWLNDYSRQGWELSNVGKYSYGFKKKENARNVNTNYPLNMNNSDSERIRLIQEYQIKNPPINVQYYFTTDKEKANSKNKEDIILSSKIATNMREKMVKLQLSWAILGVLLLMVMMLILTFSGAASQSSIGVLGALLSNPVFWVLFLIWLVGLTFILKASGYYKRIDEKYRLLTKNFSGSVLDIKFVTITSSDKNLNMDLVKDLGNWQLVSQKNGDFQYAVRTLISDNEIKQRVQTEVPDVKSVEFVKPVGFLWIP